jgi:hypothetical protein
MVCYVAVSALFPGGFLSRSRQYFRDVSAMNPVTITSCVPIISIFPAIGVVEADADDRLLGLFDHSPHSVEKRIVGGFSMFGKGHSYSLFGFFLSEIGKVLSQSGGSVLSVFFQFSLSGA